MTGTLKIWNGTDWAYVAMIGPTGPPGSGIVIKGTLSGTSTPLPASPATGDMWLLAAPIPTAAPNPSVGTKAAGDGIVWDGAAWINVGPVRGPEGPSGATGPIGPSGQAAGRIFYPATSDPSDIAGYKTLLQAPSTGAEQTIATAVSGTSDFLVAAFVTDPGVPGVVDYPAGTAFRRFYSLIDKGSANARYHLQVYVRTAAGVETLVRDEFSSIFTEQVITPQEWTATSGSAGAMTITDRIVAKLYVARTSGVGSFTVTTYFEGSAHASQVQSTISAGAQGPVGPTGPAGPAGPVGPYPLELFASDPNGAVLSTGTGKVFWTVPLVMNGFKVTAVAASVTTQSTSGLPTVQLVNATTTNTILSTPITIDINESTSYTAATPPVINSSNNTLTTGDQIRVDVTTAGTGTKGLNVMLTLTAP